MYIWVIYDISENTTRGKISKWCQQMGLQRMQKSVFLGKTKKSILRLFRIQAKQILNQTTDILFIVPMSKTQIKRMKILGEKTKMKNLIKNPSTHFI